MPGSSAYGPSKAAAIAIAEGFKFAADSVGVTIQVVNPGFVRTPLTDQNTFPMPFLMEPDVAARRLCDRLERSGFEIRFPTRFALVAQGIRSLPYAHYFPLVKAFAGGR